MEYSPELYDNHDPEVAETELTLEEDIVTLAKALRSSEVTADKFKSFKLEEGIATSAHFPERLQELLTLDTKFHNIELTFQRDHDTGSTELIFDLVAEPRVGPTYFLRTSFSEENGISSARIPLEIPLEDDEETAIRPLMTKEELVRFIASIARHETLDDMNGFIHQVLATPQHFQAYLTNPFSYQHLDSWFAQDTTIAEVTKHFDLTDPLTKQPMHFSLTFLNDDLCTARADFASGPDESYSVTYAAPTEEPAEIDDFDAIVQSFHDTTTYDDFGSGPVSEPERSSFSHQLTFAHNGIVENVSLANKQEMAARLQAILQLETHLHVTETSFDDASHSPVQDEQL